MTLGRVLGVLLTLGLFFCGTLYFLSKWLLPGDILIKNPTASQVAWAWQEVPLDLPPITSASSVRYWGGLREQKVSINLTADPLLTRQIWKAFAVPLHHKQGHNLELHNPGENPTARFGEDGYGHPWHCWLSRTRLPNGNHQITIIAIDNYYD